MDSEKGKGKASAPPSKDPENAPSKPPENLSLLSRVTASASGLTRSALTAPNASEITAAAAFSSSAKGTSSRAGTGSGSSGSAYADSSKSAQLHPSQSAGPGSGTSFRAGHSDEHAVQSEKEFSAFLDGIDSFQPSESPVTGYDISIGKDENESTSNALAEAWTKAQSPARMNPPSSRLFQHTTVMEQESRDGEDVLGLLSSAPSNSHEQFEAPEPGTEEQEYDWGLSAEQKTELRAMTKKLVGFAPAEQHTDIVDAGHSLNLIPQTQSVDLLAWREQWEGVLTRYTNEVWGGLLPLVREARREVEEMRDRSGDGGTEKSVALRRLGAILGHLQGR
ncbi:hypothetical protein LHYA1_G006146 [Lachnellula hyalina]|uniref:Uncharacterized protein n=1 Tax=Lachnellula hyalina TaxID=1316788 RepID=A0A8H8QW74_9HELO|nr:uncharacterized protein LHYA1_G006146 [Lachnellula hyalina]TVY23879.1 hypothetical protein LHYA1_G006146 [Lachnellula hyalina]